jgi:hypothetical protein
VCFDGAPFDPGPGRARWWEQRTKRSEEGDVGCWWEDYRTSGSDAWKYEPCSDWSRVDQTKDEIARQAAEDERQLAQDAAAYAGRTHEWVACAPLLLSGIS